MINWSHAGIYILALHHQLIPCRYNSVNTWSSNPILFAIPDPTIIWLTLAPRLFVLSRIEMITNDLYEDSTVKLRWPMFWPMVKSLLADHRPPWWWISVRRRYGRTVYRITITTGIIITVIRHKTFKPREIYVLTSVICWDSVVCERTGQVTALAVCLLLCDI